jgi:hypothetical protein
MASRPPDGASSQAETKNPAKAGFFLALRLYP